jgi:hypothetical protein
VLNAIHKVAAMNEEQPEPRPHLTFRSAVAMSRATARQSKIVANTLRQVIDAGLIAVCVSAAFVGFTTVDGFIRFAQVAFACALPMLILGFIGASVRPNPSAPSIQTFLLLLVGYGSKVPEGMGWIAVAAGVISVIAHGNGWAALALIPASIVALLLPLVRAPELIRAIEKQQLAKTPEDIESLVS